MIKLTDKNFETFHEIISMFKDMNIMTQMEATALLVMKNATAEMKNLLHKSNSRSDIRENK